MNATEIRNKHIDALMAKRKDAKKVGLDLNAADKHFLLQLLLDWQLRGTLNYPERKTS